MSHYWEGLISVSVADRFIFFKRALLCKFKKIIRNAWNVLGARFSLLEEVVLKTILSKGFCGLLSFPTKILLIFLPKFFHNFRHYPFQRNFRMLLTALKFSVQQIFRPNWKFLPIEFTHLNFLPPIFRATKLIFWKVLCFWIFVLLNICLEYFPPQLYA